MNQYQLDLVNRLINEGDTTLLNIWNLQQTKPATGPEIDVFVLELNTKLKERMIEKRQSFAYGVRAEPCSATLPSTTAHNFFSPTSWGNIKVIQQGMKLDYESEGVKEETPLQIVLKSFQELKGELKYTGKFTNLKPYFTSKLMLEKLLNSMDALDSTILTSVAEQSGLNSKLLEKMSEFLKEKVEQIEKKILTCQLEEVGMSASDVRLTNLIPF